MIIINNGSCYQLLMNNTYFNYGLKIHKFNNNNLLTVLTYNTTNYIYSIKQY